MNHTLKSIKVGFGRMAGLDVENVKSGNMISVRNLSNRYGDKIMLQDVGFDLAAGEFLALFGEKGAGKTTLLKILMGLQIHYSGTVKLWGSRPNRLSNEQQGWLRFVPDDIIWEEHLTGWEYLSYIQEIAKQYEQEYQDELFERFKIEPEEELLDTSYQNNKLIQIVGALCVRPKLLVLDDPFHYLGKEAFRMLCGLLKQHCEQGGSVLMAVRHYEEAREYCNRCIYLKEGKMTVNAKVSYPDLRCKAVTVLGGRKEVLEKYLPRMICERGDRRTYLYKGDMKRLAVLMYHAECVDWIVEELTLTEELEGNYARWE